MQSKLLVMWMMVAVSLLVHSESVVADGPAEKTVVIKLEIDGKNQMKINDKSVAKADLQKWLKSVTAQNGKANSLSIRAHPDCLHETVIFAIDAGHAIGVKKITLQTVDDKKTT